MSNEKKEKKESGVAGQIAVGVIVALLAGGTAPWWWDKFFGSHRQPPPVSPTPTFTTTPPSTSVSPSPAASEPPSPLTSSPQVTTPPTPPVETSSPTLPPPTSISTSTPTLPPPTPTPLKRSELALLCQEENFGRIPPINFMTETSYNLGENISIKYSGACPNKTEFLIVPAKSKPSTARNVGMRRRSVLVPDYEGYIQFDDDKPATSGMYVIQTYFTDSQRRTFLGGRSLPFQVSSRY